MTKRFAYAKITLYKGCEEKGAYNNANREMAVGASQSEGVGDSSFRAERKKAKFFASRTFP